MVRYNRKVGVIMQDIINIVMNNGIGVASFIGLLYFVNNYISKMNDTLMQVSLTLNSIKDSLITLSSRVDEIEEKIKIYGKGE